MALYMQGAIQCCAPFGSCASEARSLFGLLSLIYKAPQAPEPCKSSCLGDVMLLGVIS